MTGSVVAQAIGFAVSPVISRLFTPADFGLLGSFNAVIGVIAVMATLDYSQAIMLPKQREGAGQVCLLSCLVSVAVTGLCAGACLLFPRTALRLLQSEEPWLLVLLVMAVLAAGLNSSLQGWCVRIKAFKHTSTSQVLRGVSYNGLLVGFGMGGVGGLGLVVGVVVAEFVASLNLLAAAYWDLRSVVQRLQWSKLVALSREYVDFPLYSATQNLLNALSAGVPVLLMSHSFDIATAGAYAFGMRVLNAPLSVISGALRQVLFQKAGELQHQNQKLSPLFVKSTLGLFAIGLLPTVVLSIWSPSLFAWIFGERWRVAGEFGRYLAVWLLFVFCNLPAVLFARLIRIQHLMVVYNAVVLAVRMVAIVAGAMYLTALQTVAIFSLLGAVLNVMLIVMVGSVLLRREGQLTLSEVWAEFATAGSKGG